MTTPIPQPWSIPLFGNVGNGIDPSNPIQSFQRLAKAHGEIYKLVFFRSPIIHCNSSALVGECSDDKRFKKVVMGPLSQVRNLVHDGLFTAHLEEPNWGLAQHIVLPAFGSNVKKMFDDMADITAQLVLKWTRFGPDHVIDPCDDFTRLAFDTVALCTMSHRLNSFYTLETPPFIQAMVEFLVECNTRNFLPSFLRDLRGGNYQENIDLMRRLAREIIDHRKANPTDKKDLLSLMLARDAAGAGLSEENIIDNFLTFLIAGHETTSGMLSFTTYYLLKNPETLKRLRTEIDQTCGAEPITLQHLADMPYLEAVMLESLRLAPPAPARMVVPLENTVIGNGKYAIEKGTPMVLHATTMQRDRKVWGETADEFRPDRMLDGGLSNYPKQAWQPFGFGQRKCIGKDFAMQEAALVLATIFQSFDITLADPNYVLKIKETLTIKPDQLRIRARPREGRQWIASLGGKRALTTGPTLPSGVSSSLHPAYFLHGGTAGTCLDFASSLSADAPEHGFFAADLATLNTKTEKLPTDGPIIIVMATYYGEPADSAIQFVSWLKSLKSSASEKPLAGVTFAVFGCGKGDWATYQVIPTLVDRLLAEHGAHRLVPRGEADFADSPSRPPALAFHEFETGLWETLASRYHVERPEASLDALFKVTILDSPSERPALPRQVDATLGTVVEVRRLTKPGTPEKIHAEFELPSGMKYLPGDYLTLLPYNPEEVVQRAIKRLGLKPEQEIIVSSEVQTAYPTDKPLSIKQILSGYAELSQPLTIRNFESLIAAATQESTKAALKEMSENYKDEVLPNRTSVLDVLEEYPDIDLPLKTFLRMLPRMRVRQYSISSSPLAKPGNVTLTVSVVNEPALAGKHDRFLGVASNYLARLKPGARVEMSVTHTKSTFRLPHDLKKPVVMFCIGSGLSPFRGFIEHRAAQKESGEEIGKMMLFFGCRNPEEDYLYSDAELKTWVEKGVVDVRPAFSRKPELSKMSKYVQHRIWQDKKDIVEVFHAGARFYTCGTAKAGAEIKQVCINIIKAEHGVNDVEAVKLFESGQFGRYSTDLFD